VTRNRKQEGPAGLVVVLGEAAIKDGLASLKCGDESDIGAQPLSCKARRRPKPPHLASLAEQGWQLSDVARYAPRLIEGQRLGDSGVAQIGVAVDRGEKGRRPKPTRRKLSVCTSFQGIDGLLHGDCGVAALSIVLV
jgi:hypothetical protein